MPLDGNPALAECIDWRRRSCPVLAQTRPPFGSEVGWAGEAKVLITAYRQPREQKSRVVERQSCLVKTGPTPQRPARGPDGPR